MVTCQTCLHLLRTVYYTPGIIALVLGCAVGENI